MNQYYCVIERGTEVQVVTQYSYKELGMRDFGWILLFEGNNRECKDFKEGYESKTSNNNILFEEPLLGEDGFYD